MPHKFDPLNKETLESREREAFYDQHELIQWFGIVRGSIVADIGCGTGFSAIPMAARVGEKGKVYACDLSAEMIEAVRNKIEKWKIENIVPLVSEENRTPINDHAIDFILLSMVIHELESPHAFFFEMKRILKRGGRIGIIDWKKAESPPGPPMGERLSLAEIKELLVNEGFVAEDEKIPGKYHYAVMASRPDDILARKASKVGAKLVKELLCLSEKKMRSAMLAERLKGVKTHTIVEILKEICIRAGEKRSQYVEVLENCIDIDRLRDTLGLDRMSEIYLLAKEKDYSDVVRILMDPSPKGTRFSEYDFIEGRDIFDVTLGEKRSLAKSRSKDTLDRLLYDEDPMVIKNILNNPRITEREVLKVASKRPINPAILKVIFESTRWSSRYVVKKALVRNPCTPTGIALGLVNFMQYGDLRLIASDKTLHEEINSSARELLSNNYPQRD